LKLRRKLQRPRYWALTFLIILAASLSAAPERRKIIVNEDCSGPGGSNMQTLLLLIQSPDTEVLGITIVTGDQWRNEEAAHTLRLLEIIGRTDIPVMLGASVPLMRTREETRLWEQRFGKIAYEGAWDPRWFHEESVVPPLPEGQPTLKPSTEDAIHFLIRMVRQFPNRVTIYEGGPMTNLALAISIDPQFPQLAEQLVFMGGSLNPVSDNPEFANTPRHEFNLWFDPEAAHIVLRAPWKKIVCTPVDISIKARFTPEMVKHLEASGTTIARYIARYYKPGDGNDFMWDELAAAAWLDPSIITKKQTLFFDVDIDHGAGYGNTLTWDKSDKPAVALQPVEIHLDLDTGKFFDMFESLMNRRAVP
jgi:inosine-uridine nucleoside N-ribohydrolase